MNNLYDQQCGGESWDQNWERKGKDSSYNGYDHGAEPSKGTDVRHGHRAKDSARRKQGTYVKMPRKDHEANRYEKTQLRFEQEGRKRRLEQYWVAKNDPDRQVPHDAFIRDTRQKMYTVFDRIS